MHVLGPFHILWAFSSVTIHELSVTTSSVTYFILQADTGTSVPQSIQENLGRGLEKNEGEWTGKVEISSKKKSLAVVEACMAIF